MGELLQKGIQEANHHCVCRKFDSVRMYPTNIYLMGADGVVDEPHR